MNNTKLYLLEILKENYSEGIVGKKNITIIDYGVPSNDFILFLMIQKYSNSSEFFLSLDGIDTLIPSAAKTLVEALSLFYKQGIQVILCDASKDVESSIKNQANRLALINRINIS